MIAMTEQEKKRLEELLAEDDGEEEENAAGNEQENESEISISVGGEGFRHSDEDEATLRDIDSHLEQLIPALSSTVLSSSVSSNGFIIYSTSLSLYRTRNTFLE